MVVWFKKLLVKIIKYMSTIISGKIKSVDIDLNHTEPPTTMSAGQVNSGESFEFSLGGFINKGNIPQTITIDLIYNLVNCSLDGTPYFRVEDGITSNGNVATIQPGKQAVYMIKLKADSVQIGAPLLDFSLETDWSWS